MNLLDAVVLVAMATAALGGYRIGFLARSVSWLGLAAGFYLGLRLLPVVMSSFSVPRPTGRLVLALGLLIVVTFVGQAVGLVVGNRMRGVLPVGRARNLDRSVGAFAGAFTILIGLWLAVPTLAHTPGWPARQARTSFLARTVTSSFPEAPDATRVVRRLVDEGGFPKVFESLQPAPETGPPPVDSGLDGEVHAAVAAATVKVTGEGKTCRRIQEGSGFVIQSDVVVTNAHVVAGTERIEVMRPDGKRLPGVVSVFDPSRDLAILRVDKLGLPSLERGRGKVGEVGAVFGHPRGQESVRAAPARISEEVPAEGRDIYDRTTTRRQVFILAAALSPGDSGAPLVDRDGKLIGVAFAIAPDREGTAYALTNDELEAVMQTFVQRPRATADTRECVE